MLRASKQFDLSLKARHHSGKPLSQTWFEQAARGAGLCPMTTAKQYANAGKIVRHSNKRFFPAKLANA